MLIIRTDLKEHKYWWSRRLSLASPLPSHTCHANPIKSSIDPGCVQRPHLGGFFVQWCGSITDVTILTSVTCCSHVKPTLWRWHNVGSTSDQRIYLAHRNLEVSSANKLMLKANLKCFFSLLRWIFFCLPTLYLKLNHILWHDNAALVRFAEQNNAV